MVKIWELTQGQALAQASCRLRPRRARRTGHRPCARTARLAENVRRDRTRRPDRRTGRARAQSCSRTRSAPATSRSRRRPRWRSRETLELQRRPPRPARARAACGDRQRRAAAALHGRRASPNSATGREARRSRRRRRHGHPLGRAGRARGPRPGALPAQPARAPAPPGLRGAERSVPCSAPNSTCPTCSESPISWGASSEATAERDRDTGRRAGGGPRRQEERPR